MKNGIRVSVMAVALLLAASTAWGHGAKPLKKCPLDAVVSGI